MTQKNNFFVLPFYKSLSGQHHRKPYTFGAVYPLIVSSKSLIPFQITSAYVEKEDNEGLIISADLYDKQGNYKAGITRELNASFVQVVSDDNFEETLVFPYTFEGDLGLQEGIYYLAITTRDKVTHYSELFCITHDTSRYVKLEWYDEINVEYNGVKLLYESGFKHIAYVDSMVGKPKYDFDEEGTDRDGYFFAEKQLSKKTFRFSFVAPEYLCDALRIARLSDNIAVTFNGSTNDCDSFIMEPEWEEQGDLARVDVEFTVGTVIKKIARAWPM